MDAPRWLVDAKRVDLAVYAAIASTPTPSLDAAMRGLSRAADRSRLSVLSAAGIAVARGRTGRRAAAVGLVSVGAAEAVVNVMVKPVARRRRPDRELHAVPEIRHVAMPSSRSLPSGHAAAAFAFATGVGSVMPEAGGPLRALAAGVAYSRVHTGVHYPGDVVVGALIGSTLAQAAARAVGRS
jgi:membrane-associated phospholipid phosphatase